MTTYSDPGRTGSGPVLRWIYAHGTHRLFCELSLDDDSSVYELRTDALGDGRACRVERFLDATPAFLRHGQIEANLIRNGWTLEFYERLQPTLH
jgi:hypothetical protein